MLLEYCRQQSEQPTQQGNRMIKKSINLFENVCECGTSTSIHQPQRHQTDALFVFRHFARTRVTHTQTLFELEHHCHYSIVLCACALLSEFHFYNFVVDSFPFGLFLERQTAIFEKCSQNQMLGLAQPAIGKNRFEKCIVLPAIGLVIKSTMN